MTKWLVVAAGLAVVFGLITLVVFFFPPWAKLITTFAMISFIITAVVHFGP